MARQPPRLPASAQPHAQAQWRGFNGTAAGSAPDGSDDPKIVEVPWHPIIGSTALKFCHTLSAFAAPPYIAAAAAAAARTWDATVRNHAPMVTTLQIPGFRDLKISVVGAGMMAEAMADGLKAKNLLFPGTS